MLPFYIEQYDQLDSTNTFAKLRISQGTVRPYCVIMCRHQSKGRGTKDHTWVSLDGNIFMSIVMPLYKGWTSEELSTTAGIGVARMVEQIVNNSAETNATQPIVSIKSPNDVLINGKKVSGVLIEIESRAPTASVSGKQNPLSEINECASDEFAGNEYDKNGPTVNKYAGNERATSEYTGNRHATNEFAIIGIGINLVASPGNMEATYLQKYSPYITHEYATKTLLREISSVFEPLLQ
ncbi:MAG: hypothetical protein LBQ43_03195 [Holosporales bacterium]|jgi:biotin-(acetyl-CoA carboxylase) ligase|nr:hypothetical protein [Holosporales bacterium]